MIYYIWVINMASRYQFSDEEIKAIEQARRENKDKRAEARLKALELRAKGASSKGVAEATGFCSAYVSQLDLVELTSPNTAGVRKGYVPVYPVTTSGSIAMPMER